MPHESLGVLSAMPRWMWLAFAWTTLVGGGVRLAFEVLQPGAVPQTYWDVAVAVALLPTVLGTFYCLSRLDVLVQGENL